MTPVFGELPYSTQCDVVRQLHRVTAALARYLGDLPDEPSSAEAPRLADKRRGSGPVSDQRVTPMVP